MRLDKASSALRHHFKDSLQHQTCISQMIPSTSSHAYQSAMEMLDMKLMRNCTHLRLIAVKKSRMATRLSLQAYSQHTVSTECAMGFKCCRTPSLPSIPSRSFKPVSLLFLFTYDNACRLHVYCLNREPHLFQHTRFAVDRFHIRCSKGYLLDAYTTRNELRSSISM